MKKSSTNVFEYGVEISIFDGVEISIFDGVEISIFYGVEISIVNSNVTMSRYMICYT